MNVNVSLPRALMALVLGSAVLFAISCELDMESPDQALVIVGLPNQEGVGVSLDGTPIGMMKLHASKEKRHIIDRSLSSSARLLFGSIEPVWLITSLADAPPGRHTVRIDDPQAGSLMREFVLPDDMIDGYVVVYSWDENDGEDDS